MGGQLNVAYNGSLSTYAEADGGGQLAQSDRANITLQPSVRLFEF